MLFNNLIIFLKELVHFIFLFFEYIEFLNKFHIVFIFIIIFLFNCKNLINVIKPILLSILGLFKFISIDFVLVIYISYYIITIISFDIHISIMLLFFISIDFLRNLYNYFNNYIFENINNKIFDLKTVYLISRAFIIQAFYRIIFMIEKNDYSNLINLTIYLWFIPLFIMSTTGLKLYFLIDKLNIYLNNKISSNKFFVTLIFIYSIIIFRRKASCVYIILRNIIIKNDIKSKKEFIDKIKHIKKRFKSIGDNECIIS